MNKFNIQKYDLHMHTFYSKCSNLSPESLLKAAKKKGLNGVAVTDHNTIKGALKVKQINNDKNFEVIIGEEIMTDCGEILALYLTKEIKPGKFERVIRDIKKQKGIAIVAHPRAVFGLRKNANLSKLKNSIDAIEGFNARSFFNTENNRAVEFANKNNIPVTGGSDAHFYFEVGSGYTLFNGKLREAIKNNKTQIGGSNSKAFFARFLTVINKFILRKIF